MSMSIPQPAGREAFFFDPCMESFPFGLSGVYAIP